jgi:ABC-type nickel/cobalt efflux system permease component RcnA
VRYNHKITSNPLTFGLSMTAGIGMTVVIIALGVGVLLSDGADPNLISFAVAAGAALFVIGLGGWLAATQPWKHFDDINVAQYHGHAHEPHATDHAIVPVEGDGHTPETSHSTSSH